MKRRLQLMPEVLPAPNKTATSAVRERTMARLRVLAAVGAGIAAACGGSTTGSSGGSSSGGSSGNGGGPDGGLPDANKPDSDPGYGVVDPLPPPACFDYATQPTATAKFVEAKDVSIDAGVRDGRFIQVIVTLNQKDVAVGAIELNGSDGLSIERKDIKAGEVDLVLYQAPDLDAFNTNIQIQTSCAKGPTRVTVYVNHAAGAATKLDVSVSFFGE